MGWTDKLRGITQTFMNLLPDNGGKKSVNDEALVIKTSPTIWEYEIFRLEWDRRTILREIALMLKSDTRIKRANHVFASTAIRKGVTITVSSEVSENIAKKAQDVINDLMRDCQLNAKLLSWGRILLQEGDLFLNPIVDLQNRKIKNIKRLPGLTMQRNDDMTGNFPDVNAAFRQIDPISLDTLMEFPLWAINHIRYDHEEGERYGNSQYLACRGYWKKLNMTEEDLVVRRRTRAVPRRLHSVGNKDNPGEWSEIEKYKATNNLNAKTSQVTTDYYGNGLTDIKDLNADAQLDHINDIVHLQEVYMIGTGVPLHILGFGQNVNRDIIEDQKKQFEEDVQELRNLLEYGDSSPYSGLRFIFDFALALAGINPLLVDYGIRWFENDNDTANDRVDRVIKLRNANKKPDPLISKKLALTIVSKDLGLENESAIEAELQELDKEIEEDLANNPEPLGANGAKKNLGEITDSKKKVDFFPLHGKKMEKLEKKFTETIKKSHTSIYKSVKKKIHDEILKVEKLRDTFGDDKFPVFVDQIIEIISRGFNKQRENMVKDFYKLYSDASDYAYEVAEGQRNHKATLDSNFKNTDVQFYFLSQAGERINGIQGTTLTELRNALYIAYTEKEDVEAWEERIANILNLDYPSGRAEMIARTELAWAYNQSVLNAYKDIGVSKVRWLAIIDNRTCPACRDNNEKVFTLSELPALPLHPRCRCTVVSADDE